MVSLFFYVDDKFLIHECSLEEALKYGNFLNYKESHFDIWNKYYYKKYNVDFDYYPRGRVIYNIEEECFYIYIDKCLINKMDEFLKQYSNKNYKLLKDFHYQCHKCNKEYVL